jgi:ankyrin repeat protein
VKDKAFACYATHYFDRHFVQSADILHHLMLLLEKLLQQEGSCLAGVLQLRMANDDYSRAPQPNTFRKISFPVSASTIIYATRLFDSNEMKKQCLEAPVPLYALHHASMIGSESAVRHLLELDVEVNQADTEGANALYYAALEGHITVLNFLLKHGANFSAQGGYYGNALQAACYRGHTEVVKVLLGKNADVNAQGGAYSNALQAACSEGYIEIVKELLAKDADVNAQSGDYGNALQAACSRGYIKIVKELLAKDADINAQGGYYSNALQAACHQGYIKVVKVLLSKDADVNAQGGDYGNALQAACSEGYIEIVKELLAKDVDVNAPGGYYGNALLAACSNGYSEVVKLLLGKDADVNAQGGYYYSNALQAACHQGHIEVVKLLLDKDVDVNAQGEPYGNALQAACHQGRIEVVKLLLDKDADVNAEGGRCGNVLNMLAFQGSLALLKLVWPQETSIDRICDSQGRTPLHLAARGGHIDNMVALQNFGLDIRATDKRGKSTLAYAASSGSLAVVKFVLDACGTISDDAADWKALHWASKAANLKVIRLLTRAGCHDRPVHTSEPEALWTLTSLATFHGNTSLAQALNYAGEGDLISSSAVQTCTQNIDDASMTICVGKKVDGIRCDGCEHVCIKPLRGCVADTD